MRSAHVLPPLAVNSKSEQKVNSLPLLGFKLVIIGILALFSNYSTKSHHRSVKKKKTHKHTHTHTPTKMLGISKLRKAATQN
jgi:hypothetical protein